MDLVVFIGLQGSGKSRFYRERFAGTHVHVSRDLMRNNRNPRRRQRQLVEEALRSGRSVVVDNTNPAPADREELISLGRAFGARAVGYFFRPDVGSSLRRNAGRAGRARVPEVAIFATAKRLVPPTRVEGFDQIFEVEAVEPAGFRVAELP